MEIHHGNILRGHMVAVAYILAAFWRLTLGQVPLFSGPKIRSEGTFGAAGARTFFLVGSRGLSSKLVQMVPGKFRNNTFSEIIIFRKRLGISLDYAYFSTPRVAPEKSTYRVFLYKAIRKRIRLRIAYAKVQLSYKLSPGTPQMDSQIPRKFRTKCDSHGSQRSYIRRIFTFLMSENPIRGHFWRRRRSSFFSRVAGTFLQPCPDRF